jgi:alpha-L-fucosidase
LFLHWGISSVKEVEIGWGVFQDVSGAKGAWPVEKYIEQAREFNPTRYDPDRWLAAAARAGFRYAVLTARHTDGYALWPSDYGDFSTKQYLGGRDLVGPFVEACRRNRLKVGLYYSPTNWLFNPPGWPYRGYPLRDREFRHRRPERTLGVPRFADAAPAQMQRYFEVLYAYVKGQVEELLTRYGKIDLLWWDGYDWPEGVDIHGEEMDALVRRLQPEIVVNDRYRLWSEKPRFGDFSTAFENRAPQERPAGVWEQCEAVCGTWAWGGAELPCKSAAYLVERLVRNRAWGGNYLAGFGPRADGTLSPDYYRICDEIAAWMRHSGASVRDVEPGPYPEQCDVPVTRRGNIWYLHLLGETRRARLKGLPRPRRAVWLRTGRPARVSNGEVWLPADRRGEWDEVIEVRF